MTKRTFDSDGVEIAFLDEGAASSKIPVLFIHGFASNMGTNWVSTGWIDAALKSDRRAIAFDNRGHGGSAKLYELADYGAEALAELIPGARAMTISNRDHMKAVGDKTFKAAALQFFDQVESKR